MKFTLLFTLCIIKYLAYAQLPTHKGVVYLDDESIASGFMLNKVDDIQNHLNYLMEENINVNVLIHSKECPRLQLVSKNGAYYFEGPEYENNGIISSLWWQNNPSSFTLQLFPRQAVIYHYGNSGTPFWENTEVDFDYPLHLQDDKYYCIVKSALNKISSSTGLTELPSMINCEQNDVIKVEASLMQLPKLYLKSNYNDTTTFKNKQIVAKTNFCSNLIFYTPYLHTRSTGEILTNLISVNSTSGFALVTATPSLVSEGNVYNNVFFDIEPGSGYPENCYPLIREISEQNRLEILYKMHGNNNSGAYSNLNFVNVGSEFLLEKLLSSAENPIPGNTICDYGGSNSNGNQYIYNYVSSPLLKFYGPELLSPNSNPYVIWYNNFDDGANDIVQSCTESAIFSESNGVNMQSVISSGCTVNTPQFESSWDSFSNLNPSGNGVALWLYNDECDNRLYYEVKLSDNFTSGLNVGFGISNSDSIQLLLRNAENIVENILAESVKIHNYSNATLDESEYPENLNIPSLAMFFGVGSTCEDESPWNFGLRDGYQFDAIKLATECLIIIKEILTDQALPQRLWHPQPPKPCMLDMPGAAAGIIDGCLNLVDGKVWNLTGLLSAAVDFYKADANTRKDVLKSISNPINLILGQYPQNFQCIVEAECQEERIYCFSNLFTNAVFDIFGKSLVSVVGNISNVGAVIDEKLKMFTPKFDDHYNIWKRGLPESSQKDLHGFMHEISENSKFKLTKQVTLNKIWQKYNDGLLNGVSKADFQEFIERLPEHDHIDFYNAFDKIFVDELNEIKDVVKIKDFIEDVNKVSPDQFIDFFSEFPSRYFNAWDVTHAAGKVQLRKNSDFLNTVDEFFDNTVTQQFEIYGCSLIEEAVIRHYTGEYHGEFNMALMGEMPITDEFIEFKITLNEGLDKLPDYDGGPIYRGLGIHESEVANLWQDGEIITYFGPKFVSTSTNIQIAENFRYGNVLLIINPNKTGKSIEEISKMKHESEILYQTSKKFKVVEIRQRPSDPNVKEIVLEEV